MKGLRRLVGAVGLLALVSCATGVVRGSLGTEVYVVSRSWDAQTATIYCDGVARWWIRGITTGQTTTKRLPLARCSAITVKVDVIGPGYFWLADGEGIPVTECSRLTIRLAEFHRQSSYSVGRVPCGA